VPQPVQDAKLRIGRILLVLVYSSPLWFGFSSAPASPGALFSSASVIAHSFCYRQFAFRSTNRQDLRATQPPIASCHHLVQWPLVPGKILGNHCVQGGFFESNSGFNLWKPKHRYRALHRVHISFLSSVLLGGVKLLASALLMYPTVRSRVPLHGKKHPKWSGNGPTNENGLLLHRLKLMGTLMDSERGEEQKRTLPKTIFSRPQAPLTKALRGALSKIQALEFTAELLLVAARSSSRMMSRTVRLAMPKFLL
jgi:hypothetical protein